MQAIYEDLYENQNGRFAMELLTELNALLWGNGLVCLLLGTGVLCLLRGRCAALRSLRRLRFGWESDGTRAHSPFQACMTSLGAAMGTGNIAGVAAALTLGGAGAVFWMWIAAICGMGLVYAENVLSARYRRENVSGAAAYLRYGLQCPGIAAFFAICCTAASFGMGCMTQTHTMAQTLGAAFGISPLVTGLLAAGVTAAVILGGAKRIGAFAAAAVPVVSVLYLLAGIVVIIRNGAQLGQAFSAIFHGAFGWDALLGGISGDAVRRAVSVGVRRGVFSNEAGLGSSGLLHSEAEGDPEFLGACGILELIVDTFVCCTVTALAVLTSGMLGCGADGGELVLMAFRTGLGRGADVLLPPITAVFALCTLIGWSFCGASALRCVTENRRCLTAYRIVFCIAAAAGACMEASLVWTLSDLANAAMAYCNLPALCLMNPAAQRAESAQLNFVNLQHTP